MLFFSCRDVRQLWRLALERIAANEVANRPSGPFQLNLRVANPDPSRDREGAEPTNPQDHAEWPTSRIEPRMLKRRRHRYPLMHDPRQKLRQASLNP